MLQGERGTDMSAVTTDKTFSDSNWTPCVGPNLDVVFHKGLDVNWMCSDCQATYCLRLSAISLVIY